MRSLGRFSEALAAFEAAEALGSREAEAGKGCLLLTLGDFERGLEGYEARWLKGKSLGEALGARFETWRGPGRPGERVLVLNDHGLGDTIQFFRYLPLMAAAGVDATFVCPPRLRRLLSSKANVRFVDSPSEGRAVRRPDRDQQPAARIRHAARHDSRRGPLSRGRAGLARKVGPAHRRRRLQDRRRMARQPRSGGGSRPLHAACGAWRRSPRSRASGSFPCRRASARSSLPFCRRRCGSRRSARISTPGRTRSSTRRRRWPALDLIVTCDTSIAHLAGALAVAGLGRVEERRGMALADRTRRFAVVPDDAPLSSVAPRRLGRRVRRHGARSRRARRASRRAGDDFDARARSAN